MLEISKSFAEIKHSDSEYEADRVRISYQCQIDRGLRENFATKNGPWPAEMRGVCWPDSVAALKDAPGPLVKVASGPHTVTLDTYPFAKGSTKAAYRAIMRDERTGEVKRVVLKEFMMPQHRTINNYKSQSEHSAYAAALCENFTKVKRLSKAIESLPCRVLMVGKSDGRASYYNVEDEILEGLKRWTNNVGWNAPDIPSQLATMSKWTHDITDGFLMLTGIMGAETSSRFVLTNPVILCKDEERFKPRNIGLAAMRLCYEALSEQPTSCSTITSNLHTPGFLSSETVAMTEIYRHLLTAAGECCAKEQSSEDIPFEAMVHDTANLRLAHPASPHVLDVDTEADNPSLSSTPRRYQMLVGNELTHFPRITLSESEGVVVKACREAMLVDLPKVLPEVTKMAYITEQCDLTLAALDHTRPVGVPLLPPDQALAVVAYTFDLGMESDSEAGDDNLYAALNNALRERNPGKMRHLKAFMTHLMRGLAALNPVEAIVYRGIPSSELDSVRAVYRAGTQIHWSAFSSTTRDIVAAKRFAMGPGGILFRAQVLTGRSLVGYSQFPNEQEVLLSPNTALIVTGECRLDGEGYHCVDLVEVRDAKYMF